MGSENHTAAPLLDWGYCFNFLSNPLCRDSSREDETPARSQKSINLADTNQCKGVPHA
jgi:hypothetical protein